jgi:hypothetical protein
VNKYPYYPPKIKLIFPRLENYIINHMMSSDVLNFRAWVPTNNIIDTLKSIKGYVNTHGIIDVNHVLNNGQSEIYLLFRRC